MYWVDTDSGHRCTRHSVDFPRGKVCEACRVDPGPQPGAAQDSAALDQEILQDAGECQSRSRRLWGDAEELLDNGTAQDKSTAAKLSAESAKWVRLCIELKDRVAQRRHLREAMSHEQEMSAKRGSN